MNDDILKIRTIVNSTDFIKGRTYPTYYIKYNSVKEETNNNVHLFKVESERTYDYYKVEISTYKGTVFLSMM